MPELPAGMLRRLYQKGSLRNVEDGFEFALLNTLAPGTIIGLGPVEVDGQVFPPEQITVLTGRSERSAQRVSEQGPVMFPVNGVIRLRVTGDPLSPGRHVLVISAKLKEIGALQIEIEDHLVADR
ncbi:MAG: hydroxymethylglutaryl-CoA reductase [Chloroflexi bacterium]|nr:hydroxymethylglutaryl-CoA reductase [Chloroflexota bacterium]